MAKTTRHRAGSTPAPLHEVKFDGYRAQARIEGGRAVIMSSSGADWTAKFGRRLAIAPAGQGTRDGRPREMTRKPMTDAQ